MRVLLYFIFCTWTIFHLWFFQLNEVLRVADSFAYFQMSHFLQQFSVEWLGSWWFGFVYSLPLAVSSFFIQNELVAGSIVNIVLLNISALLLYKISRKILSETQSLWVVILFFLSPTFLHFNIHFLSENIYIPLFLWLFLKTWQFIQEIESIPSPSLLLKRQYKTVILLGCILWLLYLTRAEAFIYIVSIGIISSTLLLRKKLSGINFLKLGTVFFLSFFIFIAPYLYHLHTLTGEWWLTNKWASNLRQAELRGIERMDDAGFEQAVAELTPDKHHLIAGFAGGMKYDKPSIEWRLGEFIRNDPTWFFSRILQNQKKLFTFNLPEIFLGKSPSLFLSTDSRFGGNYLFLCFALFPLIIVIFWVFKIYQKQREFFLVTLSFFIPACIFFTLFFTLNRYFLIFLPLVFIIFVYGIWSINIPKIKIWSTSHNIIQLLLFFNLIGVLILSTLVYYNTEKNKDSYYEIKKEAGLWLKENSHESTTQIDILERFPIVTYYSGSKNRWITPYTNTFWDIVEYAEYNNIEYLVVDTLDFLTYRPELKDTLEQTPEWVIKLKEFTNSQNQKVILYQFKK